MKILTCVLVAILFVIATESHAQMKITKNYSKRFQGTIGTSPIVMYIAQHGDEHEGYYFYEKVGDPIPLSNYWGKEPGSGGDSILLVEHVWGDTVDNLILLHEASPGLLRGVWSGEKGKTLPVQLTESYPAGSYAFSMNVENDSQIFELRGTIKDTITSSYAIVLPEASPKPYDREYVAASIGHYLGCDTLGRSNNVLDCIHEQSHRYLDSTEADIVTDAANLSDSDFMDQYSAYSYYETLEMSVRYNEDDILVLDDASSFYSGGAHGMYGVLTHSFDVRNKKELKLSDITTADSATLEVALEAAFRKQYNLSPTQKLSEILFEDYLPANQNFYVTKKGIGFVYNPYEVSSFAQGIVEVFVPYALLKGKLTPWFKERIGL